MRSEASSRVAWAQWAQHVNQDWLTQAGTESACVVGFVGNRGGGKSLTMSRAMLATYRAHPFQRFIIADPHRNFSGFIFDDDGKPQQLDFRSLPAGLCRVYQPNQLHLIEKYFRSAPFHIVDMVGLDSEEFAFVSERLVATAIDLAGCTLVLDELPNYSADGRPETFMKPNGMAPGLYKIITQGRHLMGVYGKGVSLLWAVQSTKYITKAVLDQTAYVYAHKIQRPTDARGILQDWWAGAARIDLSKLKPPSFVLLKGGGQWFYPKTMAERKQALVMKGLSVPVYRE